MKTKLRVNCTKIEISRSNFMSLNLFAPFFYFEGSFQILERNTRLFNPTNKWSFCQHTFCSSIRSCSVSGQVAASFDPRLTNSCWLKAFQLISTVSNIVYRCLIAVTSLLFCSKINNRPKTVKSYDWETYLLQDLLGVNGKFGSNSWSNLLNRVGKTCCDVLILSRWLRSALMSRLIYSSNFDVSMLVLLRFCADLADFGPYCLDLSAKFVWVYRVYRFFWNSGEVCL